MGTNGASSRQLVIDNVVVKGQAENYWGGFVDGNWDDVTTNWGYGQSFTDTRNMGFTNVNFSDINDLGNQVVNTNIIVQASGVSIGTVNLLNNLASYTFSNASGNTGITGATTINKTGAGLDTFAGAETYTGNTTISAGTLALGASGSISSSPIINIASNATFDVSAAAGFSLGSSQTLTGNGTVIGNVDASAGGKVSAGAAGAVGLITFNNNLTLGGQKLTFDINATTSIADLVNVVGNLTNNGTVTIAPNPLFGALAAGTYTLINYAARTGSGTFVLDPSAPRNVSLTVGGTTLSITVAGTVNALTWQGDGTANSWDIIGTKNWLSSGTNDFFYQADQVTFDDTGSSSPAINLTTTLLPGSVTVNNNANNYTFGGSGKIGGSGALVKQGSGTLILDNAGSNNFSGGVTISAGILQVGNNDANGNLPASGSVANDGTLIFNGTNIAAAISGTISGAGTVYQTGSGTTILSGNNSYSGGTTISNGTLQLNGQNSGGTGAITINNATLGLSEGGGNTFPNSISGTGAINMVGTGTGPYTQIGTPLDGFTGVINIGYNGVGRFISRAANNGLGAGITVNITNGGQFYLQSGATAGPINVAGPGDGESGVVGTIRLEGTASGPMNFLSTNISISVNNGGGTISGAIGDGGLGYGFTKLAGNTLTLSGTNTYSGITTISAGTLALGATGSISNSAAINLAGGTFNVSQVSGGFSLNTSPSQTLNGSGTVNGSVTALASQIIPGNIGAGGHLLFNNGLTLNGQTMAFDLGATSSSSSNDLVTVLGSPLTLNSTTMISLNYLAGSISPGIYTLFTYPSITGAGTFTLASAYPGVALNVGSTATTLSVGAPSATLTWQGDGTANNWDLTSLNWLNGATPSLFAQSNNVVFNDTGSATPDVNITGNLQPGLISVTGSKNYTFSGPGSLTGAAFLAQLGSGTLIINNSNNYTGGTIIASSTLQLGTNGNTGSIAGPITDNSQLVFAHSNTNTYSNVIGGTGALAVNGSGLEILATNNTFSGGTTINAGTLQLNNATAAGTGLVTINNSVLNLLAGGYNFANGIAGSGVINIVPITGAAGNNNYAQFNGTLNINSTINVPVGPGVARVITRAANGSAGSLTFNVTNGGELYVSTAPAGGLSATVNVAGTGVGDGFGAIRIDSGTLLGVITLTGNATLGSLGTGAINSTIGDNTNGYSLTIVSHRINYSGTLTLYYGNTTINGTCTLGLVNGAAIGNSAAINIASNGTFDVSNDGSVGTVANPYPIPTGLGGVSTTQTLAGIGENGIINGSIALGSGGSLGVAIAKSVAIVTTNRPSLIVTNGTLTLANNPVIVTASALPLTGGIYPLVSVATNGNVGMVAGDVSTSLLTFAGAGLAAGASASLTISNSILYLVVSQPPATSAVFGGVSALPNNGGFQLVFSGSTGHNYSLLATTNLTLPLTNWVKVATGSFGSLPVTNIDLGATNFPQRFYDILSQ